MEIREIQCVVVHVHEVPLGTPCEPPLSTRRRAADVLPWADPYIARLIARLKQEVCLDRRRKFLEQVQPRQAPPGGDLFAFPGDPLDPFRPTEGEASGPPPRGPSARPRRKPR
ncbi:MAG: hypothetical protein HYS13_20720 [Planctomycetia bacterium]|nr:hypothetical protein [Planctomycetia bacterium]